MRKPTTVALLSVTGLIVGAVVIESCSSKVQPDETGLMIVVTTDGTLVANKLEVTVWKDNTSGTPRFARVYENAAFTLPNTIAVVSDGKPNALAIVQVKASNAGKTVDVRDAFVLVPVDRIGELRIVLSARCADQIDIEGKSKCVAGETCNPKDGSCDSAKFTSDLPTYVPGSERDSGPPVDSTVDSAKPDNGSDSDTLTPDTLPDARDTGTSDSVDAEASSDGTSADGTSDSDADSTASDGAGSDGADADALSGDADAGTDALATCGLTSTYPAAPGCPAGNHAWACWPQPVVVDATARSPEFVPLVLCGDHVILDTRTKLMWGRTEEPAPSPTVPFYSWEAAQLQCASSRRGGFSDWRLPSTIELQSIVDFQKFSTSAPFPPTIDNKFFGPTLFSSATRVAIWTSSPDVVPKIPATGPRAWVVSFSIWRVTSQLQSSPLFGVRCVR